MGDTNRDPHPDSPPDAVAGLPADVDQAIETGGETGDARHVIPADTPPTEPTGDAEEIEDVGGVTEAGESG